VGAEDLGIGREKCLQINPGGFVGRKAKSAAGELKQV
jgi:hypothetical protein